MSSRSLFVGMVTHARSRFNVDGVAAGLARSLADETTSLGLTTELLVSDRDDYNPDTMPIGRTTLVKSAIHQASLEHRWRRYLADGGASARNAVGDGLAMAGMAGKRVVTSMGDSGSKAAVRLTNIDLSHLRIMTAALAAHSDWVLVLEDDAGIDDVSMTARQIAWLIEALEPTDVAFANLSQSLSLDELGVSGLLSPATNFEVPAEVGLGLLRASRPITNTVCATLYRASYLQVLRSTILDHGLVPIAPIDWRVNEAIMDLHSTGALDSQSCVWVSPGIVLQRSMHDAQ